MTIDQFATIGNEKVPTFFYGTAWKEDNTQRCVFDALQSGFRGIDTANQRKHYYEEGVGAALQQAYGAGIVTRQQLFLQTKFTHRAGQDGRLPYDPRAKLEVQVMQSFSSSLEHLATDYLDSYVLHGPSSNVEFTEGDWEVWRAMEELQQTGRVKLLGVSNVTINQLEALCAKAKVLPRFVQNRCFANRGWDRAVRQFCAANGIRYQGFSLLTANLEVVRCSEFNEIRSRYSCSPAQLVFCFALHVGMIPLTGTTKLPHMQEDLEAYRFDLDPKDREAIERISE